MEVEDQQIKERTWQSQIEPSPTRRACKTDGKDPKDPGKAWVVLRAMRCKSRLTRPLTMCQGMGPLGVYMGCGGEGTMSDANGSSVRLFPEAEDFGMNLE